MDYLESKFSKIHPNDSFNKFAEERYTVWADSFDKVGIGISMSDARTNIIIAVNSSFANERGYSPEEMVGKPILSLFPADILQQIKKQVELVDQNSHSVFETEHVRKDGSRFPVLLDITSIKSAEGTPINRIAYAQDISERKQAEIKLAQNLVHLRAITENDLVGIATIKDRVFQWANPAFEKFMGYEKGELIGVSTRKIYKDDDEYRLVAEKYIPVVSAGNIYRGEQELVRKDGSLITVELNGSILNPEPVETLWVYMDITKRKQDEAKLVESENRLRTIINSEPECIKILDANGHLLQMNPAGLAMIEADSLEQIMGSSVQTIVSHEHRAAFADMLKRVIKGESVQLEFEIIGLRGTRRWLESHSVPMQDGGKPVLLSVTRDITERKKHESRLDYIAHYDTLTGIPNRILLADRLKQAIAQTSRSKNMMAVCYFDLDGFKPINDEYGHAAGDQVLIEIAKRIGYTIRGGDTVARLWGDEFVALLLGFEKGEECTSTLERLLVTLSGPIVVDGKAVSISASIGVSIYPLDDGDPDILLRHADQAMYVAKQSGKNRFHIHDVALDRRARDQSEFIKSIRYALEHKQFELYYQPKINLRTKKLVGAEALIRWRHPERGVLPPSEFLSYVENTDLDVAIGDWVTSTALAQMDQWRKDGKNIAVSINISGYHLESPDFLQKLEQQISVYPDIPHGDLQIEVLETVALNDTAKVRDIIEICRSFGIGFALDDFGTGYSSLSYLSGLPVDTIKIDQSFIRDMLYDKGDMAIVHGIIALAKVFKRQTVAEGIETDRHFKALLDMGCEIGQGYFMARPMTANELSIWKLN